VEALSKREAYQALSSKSRLEILKLLYKKSLSVEEIAGSLRLQPITVRHHLQSLDDAGFIEAREERSGSVGRPRVYYKIVKTPEIISFPRRHYLTLSNFLINTSRFTVGAKNANKLLKRVGKDMGEDAIKKIASEYKVENWSSKEYQEFFIEKYLEEAGAEPEIIEATAKKVVYRLHNCLFLELAIKMPEVMCDILHESFHEGVAKVMGKDIKVSRVTCMGKGDAYCEHVCEWHD